MKKEKTVTLKRLLIYFIITAGVFLIGIQCINSLSYYSVVSSKGEEYAENLTDQMNIQITETVEKTKNTLFSIGSNQYVKNYLFNKNISNKQELIRLIRFYFAHLVDSYELVRDVALVNNNEEVLFSAMCPMHDIWNNIKKEHGDEIKKSEIFDIVNTLEGNYLVYSSPIFFDISKTEYIGNMIAVFSNMSILKAISDVSITPNTEIYVCNNDKVIIKNKKPYGIGETVDAQELADGEYTMWNGKKSYVVSKVVKDVGWNLYAMIPCNEITNKVWSVILNGIILSILILIIMLWLGRRIWINIANPIHNLEEQMKHIGEKNIHQRIGYSSQNEIAQIAIQANSMLDKLERLTRDIFTTQSKLYEAKILQQETEFFALQNQINPHFLYNTLECMQDIAIVYNAKEIEKIAESMSKIFKYCVKKEEFVTLEAELDCVREYFYIMEVRFPGRFEMNIDVSENMLKSNILKFTLQPIVENAVYHGLEKKRGKGHIHIAGKIREDDTKCISIEDDGAGMDSETLERINQLIRNSKNVSENGSHGIGLENINRRIKNVYGDEYGVFITSQKDAGTKIELIFK